MPSSNKSGGRGLFNRMFRSSSKASDKTAPVQVEAGVAEPLETVTRPPLVKGDIDRVVEGLPDFEQHNRHSDLIALVGRLSSEGQASGELARSLLDRLRNARQFHRLHTASAELADRGIEVPFSQRMKAQALIEFGLLDDALGILRKTREAYADDRKEYFELIGLEGRVLKQKFVASIKDGKPDYHALKASIAIYRKGWMESERVNHWHGVNYLALVYRAAKEGVQIDQSVQLRRLASQVTRSAAKTPDDMWARASIVEASLAFSDAKKSRPLLKNYLETQPDPFALGSFRRQLKEVWGLSDPGADPDLQAIYDDVALALSMCEGGRMEFEPGKIGALADRSEARAQGMTSDLLSSVLPEEGYQSLQGGALHSVAWVNMLASLFNCIGRIEAVDPLNEHSGTGFVVRADCLHPDWAEHGMVLLTNEHVCSKFRNAGSGLDPQKLRIRFTEIDSDTAYPLGEILWCSDRTKHDVTVLTLPNVPQGLQALDRLDRDLPVPVHAEQANDQDMKVTVIGYPEHSRRPSLGIENLDLVSIKEPPAVDPPGRIGEREYVRYKSPTKPGLSGSPVFTWKKLETAAIHHWGLDKFGFNQGISIDSIIKGIAADLASTDPEDQT